MGYRLAFSLGVSLAAGHGGPRGPSCCLRQVSGRVAALSGVTQGSTWSRGSCFRGNSGSEAPERPTARVPSRRLLLALGGHLGPLIFLRPYTCHLSRPRLIGLPPRSLFPAVPLWPRHMTSVSENQKWKNTTRYAKHHTLRSQLGSRLFCFSRAGASDGLDHG